MSYTLLSDIYKINYKKRAVAANKRALAILTKHIDEFQTEEVIVINKYLQAIILDKLDQRARADKIWSYLSKINLNNIYVAHACIALGDKEFYLDKPEKAISYYDRALYITQGLIGFENQLKEEIKIKYRLLWANHRAENLKLVVNIGLDVLHQIQSVKNDFYLKGVELDAIELVGDNLVNIKNMNYIENTIRALETSHISYSVGLHIIKRFKVLEVNRKIIDVANIVLKYFPIGKESPFFLKELALAYKKSRKIKKYIDSLDRITTFLPRSSIWRKEFGLDNKAVEKMELLALDASSILAEWYYSVGMKKSRRVYFEESLSNYENLINFSPNEQEKPNWHIKKAECLYYMGEHKEAEIQFKEILEDYDLDKESYKKTLFKYTLNIQKKWKKKFEEMWHSDQDIVGSKTFLNFTNEVGDAVNSYRQQYPTDIEAINLMLYSANLFRDIKKFKKAKAIWKQILSLNSNSYQRSKAIRGIIFVTAKEKQSAELLLLLRKFLLIEDKKTVDNALRNEMLKLLAEATNNEAQKLKSNGMILRSAILKLTIAREFKDLYQADLNYKNGIYDLALVGEWDKVLHYSNKYIALDFKKYLGDIRYIIAKAYENKFDFKKAASIYFNFANKFPKHRKREKALNRAIFLANSSQLTALAGDAYFLRAKILSHNKDKFNDYKSSINSYLSAGYYDDAIFVSQVYIKESSQFMDRWISRFLRAKGTAGLGDQELAFQEFQVLRKKLLISKDQVEKMWYTYMEEISYLIVDDLSRNFISYQWEINEMRIEDYYRNKQKYFKESKRILEDLIDENNLHVRSKARYKLALLSRQFSESLETEILEYMEPEDSRYNYFSDIILSIKDLSKSLITSNLLAAQKSPEKYINNLWVKKSMALWGGGSSDLSLFIMPDIYFPSYEYKLPL